MLSLLVGFGRSSLSGYFIHYYYYYYYYLYAALDIMGETLIKPLLFRVACALPAYEIGRKSNCKSLIWIDSIDSSDCALRIDKLLFT